MSNPNHKRTEVAPARHATGLLDGLLQSTGLYKYPKRDEHTYMLGFITLHPGDSLQGCSNTFSNGLRQSSGLYQNPNRADWFRDFILVRHATGLIKGLILQSKRYRVV